MERARKELLSALREKSSKYWDLMKSWYKRRMSKDDFDMKAKMLLGDEGIQLHNEFLFAVLVKCHSGATPDVTVLRKETTAINITRTDQPEEVKRIKLDTPTHNDLTPYGAFDIELPTISNVICGKDLDKILLCSHELLLPDITTLRIRMLLGAWESGLDDVSEEVVQYMMSAVTVSHYQ